MMEFGIKKTSSITIKISPPLWLTWWAYIIYAVLILGLLLALRRYTLIGIKEKHDLILEHLEKEKAEELHQMKLQFFTNISHELRTPLTLITGPLEYLIKTGQGLDYGEREMQYHLIKKNANYLLRLVNQLLDFRRIDRGKMVLQVQKGNIVEFIREITEPFQFIADKRQIQYHIHTEKENIDLWFDPDVIEKTVYNLLSNAFKFTPEHGRISIELEIVPKGKREEWLEIRVQDTGPGIPLEKQDQIFERFYKKSSSPLANKQGTGIGLAFTKKLMELHHGEIQVQSDGKTGSCFKLLLPKQKSAYNKQEIVKESYQVKTKNIDPLAFLNQAIEQEKKEAVAHQIAQSNDAKHLPLLIVIDDNKDIRKFIRQSMEGEYQIIEAENGEEGLKKIQKQTPAMVISDIMMPVMDGIQLCQTLKSDPQTSHIPVILLTAKSSDDSELQGLNIGADAYIRKPFRMDILKVKTQNIIRTRQELKNRFRREILLEPEEVTVTSTDEIFLKKAMDIVEEHMGDPDFNVENMVKEIGMSRSQLYLKLKALTDQSTSEFIRTVRLKRAVQLLGKSDMTVKEIMYMTGFNTASYFSKCFKKQFGVLPSEYLKKEQEKSI